MITRPKPSPPRPTSRRAVSPRHGGSGALLARPSSSDRGALRDLTVYALPLLVLNVSAQILVVSDLAVIGALVGASAVGVYQVGALLPLRSPGFS